MGDEVVGTMNDMLKTLQQLGRPSVFELLGYHPDQIRVNLKYYSKDSKPHDKAYDDHIFDIDREPPVSLDLGDALNIPFFKLNDLPFGTVRQMLVDGLISIDQFKAMLPECEL